MMQDFIGHFRTLKGDRTIIWVVIILSFISIVAVYSAATNEAYKHHSGNTEFYLFQQVAFIGIGILIMMGTYATRYTIFMKLAPILLVVSFLLLCYTMFFGLELNEARRWIKVPLINKTFQSSDVAKLSLIMFLAYSLTKKQGVIKKFKEGFLPLIAPIFIICGLIAVDDLSTAILLFVTGFLMLFIGRVSIKYLALLVLLGLCSLGVLLLIGHFFPDMTRFDTWMTRITDFFNDGQGYQIEQSKMAIALGGFFGEGPGHSVQRNYLPYAYADFIFAIICEEGGLIAGFVVMLLYLVLLFRCIKIVTVCPRAFGALMSLGLCLNLVLQAFANIAVTVNLVPVTGLTLPLISMGGTSLLFTCISLGIILSVSRHIEEARLRKLELNQIEAQ